MTNKTQKQRIIGRLKEFGQISRNECLRVYITRLASIISDLRQDGWEFSTKTLGGDYIYKVTKYPMKTVTQSQIVERDGKRYGVLVEKEIIAA